MTEPPPPTPASAADPSTSPSTAAWRIQDSLDRAQNLPHRTGSIDPRDANGMALAARLASNALPDPVLFSTWIGASQTKIALEHAVAAYRDGDHVRVAAWLEHVSVLLDANGIPAAHPSRDYINNIVAVNAAHLGRPANPDDARDPAPGRDTGLDDSGMDAGLDDANLDAAAGRHRDLIDRVADYEAVAERLHGIDYGRLGRDQLAIEQLAEKAALRIALAEHPDRLLADALTERLAVADSRAEQPIRDEHPELNSTYPDPLQAYRDGYVTTPLQDAVDEAAYLARIQNMRQGAAQGADPGWVHSDTVFTDRHLAAAHGIYELEIGHIESGGRIASASLDALRSARNRIAAATRDMGLAGRTTTSLHREPAVEAVPLPAALTDLGLRTLIEHYEIARTESWPATRTQPALRLRSRVEDYAQAHQLRYCPLIIDLADRDWAQQHAWTVLTAWREQTDTGRNLDAGAAQMTQIRTLRQHYAALTANVSANLAGDRDLPAFAAAMTRAQAAGYDLHAHIPQLTAQAPLPAEHPLRELHYRLLIDCPAALPDPASSRPAKPLPPGYRIDEAGVEDHAFYLVTTCGGQVVGAGHDRGQAEHLAHTHALARNRLPAPPPPSPPRRGPAR